MTTDNISDNNGNGSVDKEDHDDNKNNNDSTSIVAFDNVDVFQEQLASSQQLQSDGDGDGDTQQERSQQRKNDNSTNSSCKSSSSSSSKEIGTNNNNDTTKKSGKTLNCPICLLYQDDNKKNSLKFVYGKCNHAVCLSCMEHVLHSNKHKSKWPPTSNHSELQAPTIGKCPICRFKWTLFDMKFVHNNEFVTTKQQMTLPKPLHQATFVLYNTPYIGMESIHFSISSDTTTTTTSSSNSNNIICLNVSKRLQTLKDWVYDHNGQPLPPLLYFENDWHYHTDSETFHGKIIFANQQPNNNNDNTNTTQNIRFRGAHSWDFILGFATPHYRYISCGMIVQHRNVIVSPERLLSISNEHQFMYLYPLDGRWVVQWPTPNRQQQQQGNNKKQVSEITIQVQSNHYIQSNWPFYLQFTNNKVQFKWPRSKTIQYANWDFLSNPTGPRMGDRLVWTTTDPKFTRIVWIRQTIGTKDLAKPRVYGLGSGADKKLYQVLPSTSTSSTTLSSLSQSLSNTFQNALSLTSSTNNNNDNNLSLVLHTNIIPQYHADTLWGNVFCKRLRVGSASYHFMSPTECYISYEHPICRESIPSLDDGSPMPLRVNMSQIEYDTATYTLKCQVDWEQECGTSWNDNVKWKFDMTFDSQYTLIKSGGIQCEWTAERRAPRRPPRPPPAHRPPPVAVYVPPPQDENQPTPPVQRNEEWRMSGYGADQLYINAAVLERYKQQQQQQQDNHDGMEQQPPAWQEHCVELCRRLKEEGATNRSIGVIEHVFRTAQQEPNSNPIDFNII